MALHRRRCQATALGRVLVNMRLCKKGRDTMSKVRGEMNSDYQGMDSLGVILTRIGGH